MTGTLCRVKRLLAVVVVALALPASALAWGGSYPTGDSYGTYVQIQVSDTYPVDQALPQDWATYLGTLVHGTELARLTLSLMPLSDVQAYMSGYITLRSTAAALLIRTDCTIRSSLTCKSD